MQEVPWRFVKSLSAKKERVSSRLTVAEGPPSVTSALESGVAVEFLVMSDSFVKSPAYDGLEKAMARQGAKPQVFVVSDALFERMSEMKSPQGVLCVLPFPFVYPLEPPRSPWKAPLYLYGFDIQDPGNAGTLIRAAAAAGVTAAVFCGESADVFSPKCIRSSAGAVFKVPVEESQEPDPVVVLQGVVNRRITVYKAAPREGEPPWQARLCEGCAIVVGNEARGLSREVLEGPGQKITVPMPGDTESLNVAIASAVLLYEAVRQRLLSNPPALMV